MKHTKRNGKRVSGSTSKAGRKRAGNLQIVLLDQSPLRKKAASECSKAMTRLEKAKAEWKRFDSEDKPAFERWMAATFGAQLSRLREMEAQIREKAALVEEVQREMYFGAGSYRNAYNEVQKRRSSPPPAYDPHAGPPPPMDEDDEDSEDGDFEDIPESEKEELFKEFVRDLLGINPARMDKKTYAKMFAEFKANVFDDPPPEGASQQRAAAEPPKPGDARIKELYRILVRRLHPDTRAESDAAVSAVWHEVQEAYSTGNLERLEMLLALTDIQSNTAGEHTSLFQMRAVLAELRNAYNALQRSLRLAKKDPAWNFARTPDHSKLQEQMKGELDMRLTLDEGQLKELETLIARWSAPAKPRKKSATRKSARLPQPEFFF